MYHRPLDGHFYAGRATYVPRTQSCWDRRWYVREPQDESHLPMDSCVGTQIRWHYTRETETRSESHLPRDSSVGTPMQWHFTLKTFWHYTPEA